MEDIGLQVALGTGFASCTNAHVHVLPRLLLAENPKAPTHCTFIMVCMLSAASRRCLLCTMCKWARADPRLLYAQALPSRSHCARVHLPVSLSRRTCISEHAAALSKQTTSARHDTTSQASPAWLAMHSSCRDPELRWHCSCCSFTTTGLPL